MSDTNDVVVDIQSQDEKQIPFKKPLLIGKVGRFPRKLGNIVSNKQLDEVKIEAKKNEAKIETKEDEVILNDQEIKAELLSTKPPVLELEERNLPLPYKEPSWSGLPVSSSKDYKLQVLKSGAIVDNINVMGKTYWVFGRLGTCDVTMAHPTISRYHAVLQYKTQNSADQPVGFYLYDLTSTHGTFLNKSKLKPRVYARVQVGHMIKLGCSTRTYLLTGPQEDTEEETQLTITELKKQRAEQLVKREEAEREAILKKQEEEEAIRKKIEDRGIDWGMGEDADEETDLIENPFAQTNNEELYIDDPKKALRGFMEREGHDLVYDCNEQGMGQFVCKVDLPLYDDYGKPIVVEVVHKGKKKEAVVQCALEACRLLDRHGLLRQATHESRKRKAKNWEENDFYDSDDDTFLDRTGTVEKKREHRMKTKVPQQPETYQSLIEKENLLSEEIKKIEKQLSQSNKNTEKQKKTSLDEDSLELYMKELKQSKLDKSKISKLKTDLSKLKQDYGNVIKLINVARPADLPPLVPQHTETTIILPKNKLPIFGKRLKIKVQKPLRLETDSTNLNPTEDVEEESDEDQKTIKKDTTNDIKVDDKFLLECKKIEASFKKIFPLMSTIHEQHLTNLWSNLNKLFTQTNTENVSQLFSDYVASFSSVVVENFSKQIDEINTAVKSISDTENVIDIGRKIIDFAKEITHVVNRLENQQEISVDEKEDVKKSVEEQISEKTEDLEKRRRKNQRRILSRQEKAEVEKQKGYQEDASRDDYNMWVPPVDQTGDGRTRLNDKLGY